ncbi:hypothetical protein [uncultured Sphingomonas sp.]|uniref:hypothetical protein n=1 Tax=uncultured Sphingomonas sp. TaxID=158754 RepID=UPI00261586A1|nr:hypothetical protein [uncultured Sphingomonas sp.]
MKPLLPLAALALLLGACAEHEYPSLLPRAGERLDFREPAPPPPAPVVVDPELDSRIAAARDSLKQAGEAFDNAVIRAERLTRAAGNAPVGSDAWLDAQTAMADLDSAHARQVDVLTDLEQFASDRALALAPAYPALEQAITQAQQAADASMARITMLQRRLSPAG